ncbi:serine kinase/phosphatase [Pseudomonas cavernae]|uniref:Serine kinase/phosphatase n=1 Tax=Pseudomonas cavernae TaxID=2320867 RepID=A0A385Z2B8_9PSED|nr:serine kinase/phosphatase [Pseudomonas cavernae]AYC31712.1 serine kinase/phosphatase [Pseudomonas cavernae]
MTQPRSAKDPQPIDDSEDYMDSVEELDLEPDPDRGRIGDTRPESAVERELPPHRVRQAGLTGAATPDHEAIADDLDPQILIAEDGARSPDEPGENRPTDTEMRIVGADEIGAGGELEEAEREDALNEARQRNPLPE